jgi:hypothetical protein
MEEAMGVRRLGSIALMVGLAMGSFVASAEASVAAKASKRDKAILAAGSIRASDVPSAWTSSRPSNTTGNDIPTDAECRSIKTATDAGKRVPNTLSRQFRDPNALTIADDQAFAFKNVNAARSYLADYKSSNVPSCLQKVFARPFGPTGTQVQGTPAVSPITDLQGVGDENVGYEVVVNLTTQGQNLALYWDLVYVRVGRAIVHFVFNNEGQRISQGRDIVNAVISRLGGVAQ